MKKFLKTFLFVLALLIGLLYISDYSYLLNAVSKIYFNGHTTAFLDDYKYFDNATLPPSENPQAWPLAKQYNQWSVSESLEAYHKTTGTVAFMVIKNDSLLYCKINRSCCNCKNSDLPVCPAGKNTTCSGDIYCIDEEVHWKETFKDIYIFQNISQKHGL